MPIPCPHFKITIVKRSQGQSAVAGAAYQSGERLFSCLLYTSLLVAAAGGGALYYFKILKPKQDAAKGSSSLDDLDFGGHTDLYKNHSLCDNRTSIETMQDLSLIHISLAALDDSNFEMRTRNRHHLQTKRPPSKIALDERSGIVFGFARRLRTECYALWSQAGAAKG